MNRRIVLWVAGILFAVVLPAQGDPAEVDPTSVAPTLASVREQIAAGALEAALDGLDRLAIEHADDVEVQTARLHVLLALQESGRAAEAARHLAQILPEGLAKTATAALGERLAPRPAAGRVQALLERASVLRERREPQKLLGVLIAIAELQPDNPAIHYALGEVRGSAGLTYERRRAIESFEEFLRLAAAREVPLPDASAPRDQATLGLGTLFGFESDDFLGEMRMRVADHLVDLRGKKPLYVLSSRRIIEKRLRILRSERQRSESGVDKAERELARLQDALERQRASSVGRNPARAENVASLTRGVEAENRRLEIARAKLTSVDEKIAELQGLLAGSPDDR